MRPPLHPFHELFAQLGLPYDSGSIDQFIASHAPLDPARDLADAPFWSAAQATFLREGVLEDSDWALPIDQLNQALRQPPPRAGLGYSAGY